MLENTKEQRKMQKNHSKPIMSISKDKSYNYDQTIFEIYGYGDNKKITVHGAGCIAYVHYFLHYFLLM